MHTNNLGAPPSVRLSDYGGIFYGGPSFKKNMYDPVLQQVGMTAEEYRAVTTRADKEGRSSYVSVLAILSGGALIAYRKFTSDRLACATTMLVHITWIFPLLWRSCCVCVRARKRHDRFIDAGPADV